MAMRPAGRAEILARMFNNIGVAPTIPDGGLRNHVASGAYAGSRSGASNPVDPGASVVDTSGNRLGFGGAFSSILGNESLGEALGKAVPGGGFSGVAARALRSLAGGPFGVVGTTFGDARIGSPAWDRKMAAIREAQRRNEVVKRAPARTTRAFQGLSDGGRDAAHDPQGHGGGGQLGSDRDSRAGGPR